MIEKLKPQDIFTRELNKHIEKKALLEIEIAYQRQLSPTEMNAKRPKAFGSNGQPISFEQISRADYIVLKEAELEQTNLIIKTIEAL